MRNFFTLFFVLLNLLSNSAYTASSLTERPYLSCTFEPGMGKGLEVLAYLDDQYKDNSYGDRALLIYNFIRTGQWEGEFRAQQTTFKGLRYHKPANANEKCLIYKGLIRTTAQIYGNQKLRPTLLKNAAEKIQQLIKKGDYKALRHQLIILIVLTLADSDQTVSHDQILEHTKKRLIDALTVPGLASIFKTSEEKQAIRALEKLIVLIWNSASFKTAIDIIKFERENDIKSGNLYLRKGDNSHKDKEAQREFYKKALNLYWNVANQGDPHARFLLGKLFSKGQGLVASENKKAIAILMNPPKRDREDAFLTLKVMANGGNSEASFALKEVFTRGLLSLPKDLKAAFYWLNKAAEQDHPEAQYSLSQIYEKDPNKHPQKAAQWLSKAAENGHEKAQQKVKAAKAAATPPQEEVGLEAEGEGGDEDEESGTIVIGPFKKKVTEKQGTFLLAK